MAMLRTAHVFHNPTPPWRVTKQLLDQCPELLFCSPDGAGYDAIDVDACTEQGICVANQSGVNANTVAEFAVAMMMAHARQLLTADRAMRRDRGWTRLAFTGRDLRGQTVGVVGFGNIGSRVSKICRDGLGMTVLAYDPYLSPDAIVSQGAKPADLATVLSLSDIITIYMPLTSETRGMIGEAELNSMKSDAILVTTSRGGVVDEAALAAAVSSGAIAGACVDVWSVEPPPLDHPLLAMEQIIATPHIAGSTTEGYRAVAVAGCGADYCCDERH